MNDETPTAQQIAICEQFHSPLTPYTNQDMVAVAMGSLGLEPTNGVRVALAPNENIAWFFYCGEASDEPDFYQAMHIGHLQDYLPQVIDYLCLAPGFKFIIDSAGYQDVWQDDADLE